MATSGSTTFELARDDIIQAAIRKLAVLGDGQLPSTTQVTAAAQALNAMLKTFQAYGMPLWAIKEYTLTPPSTATISIGVGQTLNVPAPLKVTQATITNTAAGTSIPLNIVSHYDYNLLAVNTQNTGYPVHLSYEPLAKTGLIKLWPIADATTIANNTITIVYQRPFEEFVSATDTPDFPSYWTEALIYGLAWRLAPEYNLVAEDRAAIAKEAEMFKTLALEFGVEEGSLSFQPDWTGR